MTARLTGEIDSTSEFFSHFFETTHRGKFEVTIEILGQKTHFYRAEKKFFSNINWKHFTKGAK